MANSPCPTPQLLQRHLALSLAPHGPPLIVVWVHSKEANCVLPPPPVNTNLQLARGTSNGANLFWRGTSTGVDGSTHRPPCTMVTGVVGPMETGLNCASGWSSWKLDNSLSTDVGLSCSQTDKLAATSLPTFGRSGTSSPKKSQRHPLRRQTGWA